MTWNNSTQLNTSGLFALPEGGLLYKSDPTSTLFTESNVSNEGDDFVGPIRGSWEINRGGKELELRGNIETRLQLDPFLVTSDTIVQFDYFSDGTADWHGFSVYPAIDDSFGYGYKLHGEGGFFFLSSEAHEARDGSAEFAEMQEAEVDLPQLAELSAAGGIITVLPEYESEVGTRRYRIRLADHPGLELKPLLQFTGI